MPFPVAAAIAAGTALAGQGIQSAGAAARNQRQYHIQKKLMDYSQQQNKAMALFNQQQQMQMWKETGPVGQMQQLKAAGLNPGLIYGMGGAGGQTANASQGGMQGTPTANVENVAEGMGMTGANLALQIAEIENIKAQTAKTKAETPAEGQTTQKILTEIESLSQGINESKARQKLTEIDTELANIDKQIKSNTQADVTDQITNQARKTQQELEILQNTNAITTEQAVNARQTAAENLIQLQLQNAQSRKQLNLTDQQIEKLKADIRNTTNLADLQLKIQDLPQSVRTIVQTIFSLLHLAK